jgi:hypothetical protein
VGKEADKRELSYTVGGNAISTIIVENIGDSSKLENMIQQCHYWVYSKRK